MAFCFYNLSSIVNSLIYFDQLALLSTAHLLLVILGIIVLLSGVVALSLREHGIEFGTWREGGEALDAAIVDVDAEDGIPEADVRLTTAASPGTHRDSRTVHFAFPTVHTTQPSEDAAASTSEPSRPRRTSSEPEHPHNLGAHGRTPSAPHLTLTRRQSGLGVSDLAQPATHPRIPYMQVTVVAQHSPIFPWPFWVKNKHGITVGDVVGQIYANFREFVGKGEFDRWEPWRKHESCTACLLRYCEAKNWYMAEEEDNQLMRIDYLCGHIMFDGMKPHPNGEGWVISVRPRTVAEIHADTTYYNQRLPPGLSVSPMGQFTAEIAARGDLPPA